MNKNRGLIIAAVLLLIFGTGTFVFANPSEEDYSIPTGSGSGQTTKQVQDKTETNTGTKNVQDNTDEPTMGEDETGTTTDGQVVDTINKTNTNNNQMSNTNTSNKNTNQTPNSGSNSGNNQNNGGNNSQTGNNDSNQNTGNDSGNNNSGDNNNNNNNDNQGSNSGNEGNTPGNSGDNNDNNNNEGGTTPTNPPKVSTPIITEIPSNKTFEFVDGTSFGTNKVEINIPNYHHMVVSAWPNTSNKITTFEKEYYVNDNTTYTFVVYDVNNNVLKNVDMVYDNTIPKITYTQTDNKVSLNFTDNNLLSIRRIHADGSGSTLAIFGALDPGRKNYNQSFTEKGYYKIIATDRAGNQSTIEFTIE